jgi:8-oxo-dGTP pyrophosphatase MutT (NUDIX family)
MIQRKDSLCFMEFIRGKYETSNNEYIRRLLSGMTIEERDMLVNRTFEELWNYIWLQPSIPRLTLEYESAVEKFVSIRGKLDNLLNNTTSPYSESEFGFPKGRRKLKENDIVCAIREFHEETGFSERDIQLHSDMTPYEEVFYGTNDILYRHVYYLAKMVKTDCENPQIDFDNINQVREVRSVQWFNYADTVAHIRDYNVERKNLFEIVHKQVLALQTSI